MEKKIKFKKIYGSNTFNWILQKHVCWMYLEQHGIKVVFQKKVVFHITKITSIYIYNFWGTLLQYKLK